jgi:hypothetical protein
MLCDAAPPGPMMLAQVRVVGVVGVVTAVGDDGVSPAQAKALPDTTSMRAHRSDTRVMGVRTEARN